LTPHYVPTDCRPDSGRPFRVYHICFGGAGLRGCRVLPKLALGAQPHVSGVPYSRYRDRSGAGMGQPSLPADNLGERTPACGRGAIVSGDIRGALGRQVGVL